jgi:hypothetical protein
VIVSADPGAIVKAHLGAEAALGRTWKEDHEHCSHAALTPKRPLISPASRFFVPAIDTANHKNKM